MGIISVIFIRVLLLSLLAIPLVLVILVFRQLFSKIRKTYVLLLWSVLAVRLICPVIWNNPLSIVPVLYEGDIWDSFSSKKQVEQQGAEVTATPIEDIVDNSQTVTDKRGQADGVAKSKELEQGKTKDLGFIKGQREIKEQVRINESEIEENKGANGFSFSNYMAYIWLIIFCLLWIYGLFRGIVFSRRLRDAVPLRGRVYISDRINEPFAFGIISPRIYIPSGMAEEHREVVLFHEQEHIRHHDTRIKVFAYLLVCIYWFSPLIIVAYFMFLTDMEMACDERVVKDFDGRKKQAYVRSLLACGSGNLFSKLYPVAFGETAVSKRIHNVIRGQSLSNWAGKGMILLVLLIAMCFGSGCQLIDSGNSKTGEPFARKDILKQDGGEGRIEWMEDITGDNKPEKITVDLRAVIDDKGEVLSASEYQGNGKEATVYVTSGENGEALYSLNINPTNHTRGLYLYKKKLSHRMSTETEKSYFLLWEPSTSLEGGNYHYEIFSLSERGEKRIEEEKTFTREEKLPQSSQTYLERINEYLFHSVALVDTVLGVTRYSEEQEKITLLYDADEQRQKPVIMGAAKDYAKDGDFIRVKSNDGWNPLQSSYPGIPLYVANQDEWNCKNHRFRVYFYYDDKDTRLFGYRNEEEIEAKEGEEQYKENYICINTWELKPSWAPYIIISPPYYEYYKEHMEGYHITAYVVDEQETKILAKQTITIECRENQQGIMSYYVCEN